MRRTATSSSAGGYDLTGPNLQAVKDGHAYVTLGQSAFVQGYLPVALLVKAIHDKKPLDVGFYNAGSQAVTAGSVDMANKLPRHDLRAAAGAWRPTRRRRPPSTSRGRNASPPATCLSMEPIAAEAQ